MMLASARLRALGFVAAGMFSLTGSAAFAQTHGRKYQPPPATSHIVVTVEKGFNSKPLVNAAVIFHATKDGKDTGNMEVKTNNEGEATMDFIEAGSHVTVQVIANGFATHAEEFDVTADDKLVLVKLARPEAQVSDYKDNEGKPAQVQPGVQEREKPAPAATPQAGTVVPPQ